MNWPAKVCLLCLGAYRWILSPGKNLFFGGAATCRFTPSCSAYAMEAIRAHGTIKGLWLTLHRLTRCHPWGGCGHDPVPRKATRASQF